SERTLRSARATSRRSGNGSSRRGMAWLAQRLRTCSNPSHGFQPETSSRSASSRLAWTSTGCSFPTSYTSLSLAFGRPSSCTS
ncbi:hypothetical protein V5O48_019602, partial [Marasmius crinis-equi]